MKALACWLCLLLGGQQGYTQLIDTVEDPRVTKLDSINRRLTVVKGFTVQILAPELLSNHGVPVKSGFDTYYIYTVRAQEIYLEGLPLDNNNQPTFLPIASRARRIELGDTLTSRALFIKALIAGDKTENRPKEYRELAEKLAKDADSLRKVVDSTFMPEPSLMARAALAVDSVDILLANADAFELFLKTKGDGQQLAKFFLSEYFSRSDKYHIYSHPYGLPEFEPTPPVVQKVNWGTKVKAKHTPLKRPKQPHKKILRGKWYR